MIKKYMDWELLDAHQLINISTQSVRQAAVMTVQSAAGCSTEVHGGFLEPGKSEERAARAARSQQLPQASGADAGVEVASSNRGGFKRPLRTVSGWERGEQSGQTGRGMAVCAAVGGGRARREGPATRL